MSSPKRHPKTGQWYFRRAIPVRLRPVLKEWGREYKRSLGTPDPVEAKRLWPIEAAQCEALFAEAEARLARANGEPMTREEMQAAARAWIRAKLDGTTETHHALVDLYIDGTDPETGETHASIRKADVAEAFGGAKVDLKAAREVLAAEAIKALEAGHTMRDALEGWRRESEATPSTAQEWGRVVERFGPDKRVEAVTVEDAIAFKDGEVERGLAKGTVEKYMTALRTVLGYAVEKRWIAANPAAGIKLRVAKSKQTRLPFTTADLRLIFGGPVHAKRETPTMATAGGAAAFWLPVLALYTGARQSELAQLDAADVGREDGVAFIEISDRGEGQRVKNAGSRRRVPLHPDIEAEFLAFVPAEGLLFPDLRPSTFGDRSKAWSRWWSRYMRRLGVIDKRKVFHSFRHLYKDLCREVEIPEDVRDALAGHTGGGVGRAYGAGYSIKALAGYVGRIKVPVKVFGGA